MATADIFLRLRANSAELTKGLQQAQGSMKKTGDASSALGKQMKGVFQEAARAVDNIIPGFSTFITKIGGASTAITAMSGALKILKIALISTGIGAIVVALGSLIAYFKTTEKGALAFSKVLNGIKTVISVVVKRLAFLGEAIVKLLKRDFKGAAEAAKAAFSGVGEEIKDTYKTGVELEQRRFDLEKARIAFLTREQELNNKIAKAKELINSEETSSLEKQKAINEAAAASAELYATKVEFAKEEAAILIKQNDQANNLTKNYRAEEEAKASILHLEEEKSREMQFINSMQKRLNAQIGKEVKELTAVALARDKAYNLSGMEAAIKAANAGLGNIKMPTFAPKVEGKGLMAPNISFVPNDLPEWKSYWDAVDGLALDSKEKRMQIMTDAANVTMSLLSSVANFQQAAMNRELAAAGDNEAKKDAIRRKYAKKGKTISIAQATINGAVAVTKAFAELGPIAGAIAAAVIGLTTLGQIALISSTPFAKGGLAYGPTLGLVGEYSGASTNPEVIAPLSDLKKIMANSVPFGGDVRFVIEQNQLVGILENYNKKNIYF